LWGKDTLEYGRLFHCIPSVTGVGCGLYFFFSLMFFSFFPYTFCDRSRVWIVRADVRTPTATFSTVSEWEEYEGGADGQL